MKAARSQIAVIAAILALFVAVVPVSPVAQHLTGAFAAPVAKASHTINVEASVTAIEPHGRAVGSVSSWPESGYDATNSDFNPNEHKITAANVATLAQVWQHGGDGTYSDPVVGSGDVALATRSNGRCSGVEVLNQNSGDLVWGAPITAFQCTDPVISDGRLLVVTNNPWKLYVWKLSNGRRVQEKALGHSRFTGLTLGHPRTGASSSGSPRKLFLNGASGWVKSFASGGKQVWAYNTDSTLVDMKPVLDGGIVYVLSARGIVFGINAVNGKLSWKKSISVNPSLGAAKLAVADGMLFISSGPNRLIAVNISGANPKARGSVVWRDVGIGYNTDFAVAYHMIFITSPPQGPHGQGASIFGLKDGNGRELWQFTTNYVGADPSVANGIVYVSNNGVENASRFYAVNVTTGVELWSVQGAGPYPGYPAITGGRVYLSNRAFAMTPGKQDKPPWRIQHSPVSSQLADVSCSSTSECFAVGANGTIVKTINSGKVWTRVSSRAGTGSLVSVRCPVPGNCSVVDSPNTILRTTDGGKSWSKHTVALPSTLADLAHLACPTEQVCYATASPSGDPETWFSHSGGMYKTSDGGRSWSSQKIPAQVPCNGDCSSKVGYDLQWISCQNVQRCRAGTSTFIGSHEGYANAVIATHNGGRNWDLVSTNFAPNIATCPTTTVCTGVFNEPTTPDTSIYLLGSADGGRTWSTKQINPPVTAISCTGARFCELGGLNGVLALSLDSNLQPQISPTKQNINAIACPGVDACYAVGDKGTILARVK